MRPIYLEFEERYAKYVGTKGCVTTNTGTSALHVALEALELNPGDEVIVPEFTMIASAWAVVYAGLKPVFVDCNDELLIDTHKIVSKITPRTKAIMVTHVYGRVCDMGHVIDIASRYGLRVIEDACEAQGAFYEGRKQPGFSTIPSKMVGSYDIGCFSFYRNKIIHAEEGGAITSDDEAFLARCRDLKSMSFGEEHNYLHGKIGFNYRMTNNQAMEAMMSLFGVDYNNERRIEVKNWYNQNIPTQYWMPNTRKVVWVYDIKVPADKKDGLVAFLNDNEVAARHSFKPMSMQPTFNYNYKHLNAYEKSRTVCYLPVNPDMREEEVIRISNLVKEFL